MGFVLAPIFIKSENSISDEAILNKVGLDRLTKGEPINFYATNKKWEQVFIGTKGNCKIICNGGLASKAFEKENPFVGFENSEIAVIIWNSTSDYYGFCLFKNGKVIRKVVTCDGEFEHDYGNPIAEELAIKEDEIFMLEEMEEMIENEGKEGFEKMVKAEKVCIVADMLANRYLGTCLLYTSPSPRDATLSRMPSSA